MSVLTAAHQTLPARPRLAVGVKTPVASCPASSGSGARLRPHLGQQRPGLGPFPDKMQGMRPAGEQPKRRQPLGVSRTRSGRGQALPYRQNIKTGGALLLPHRIPGLSLGVTRDLPNPLTASLSSLPTLSLSPSLRKRRLPASPWRGLRGGMRPNAPVRARPGPALPSGTSRLPAGSADVAGTRTEDSLG